MSATHPLYRLAVHLGAALAPVAGIWNAKVRVGHAGRVASLATFRKWGQSRQELSRPLVLFHAPSAGEARQAEAVIRRLKARQPTWRFGFTYFSPSAEPVAAELPVDLSGYLPYDRVRDVTLLLDSVRPSALVFTKLDLWPELAVAAQNRGIPVAMVAGRVRPGSGRLRWPARGLLAPGYAALTRAAVVDRGDAERLNQLGTSTDRIEVAGDPRYDSVAQRVADVSPDDPLLRLGNGCWTIVAGSTWPADIAVTLEAFSLLRPTLPESRLIVVPHEPSRATLSFVKGTAARLGLPEPRRIGDATDPGPVMVEDRIGALARLYGAGQAAFVGGGFGSAGLHSVLEPAAWAMPVSFGPHWRDNPDADRLIREGGAVAIGNGADGPAQLAGVWRDWSNDERRRSETGERARAVVTRELGAAERCAALVERLVTSVPAPRLQTSPSGG